MKRLIKLPVAVLFVCLTVLTGCFRDFNCISGAGPVIVLEIPLATFDKVTFEVAGNVTITQDSVQRVTVESNSNVIANLNTSVGPDGVWKVAFLQCMNHYDQFEVTISVVDINQIVLAGSGNITSEGTLEAETIELFIPGAGAMDLDLKANRVNASITGAGAMNLEMDCEEFAAEIRGTGSIITSGFARNQDLFIGGSGGFFGFNLESETCDILISGSGSCEINVSDQLDVTISGSGSVRYKGNPNVTSNVSGSGTVAPSN